jgi:hypothetical protein
VRCSRALPLAGCLRGAPPTRRPLHHAGQGLIAAPAPVGASDRLTSLWSEYRSQRSSLAALRAAFKGPQSAAAGVTLGAAGDADSADAALFLAALPDSYSSADPKWTGEGLSGVWAAKPLAHWGRAASHSAPCPAPCPTRDHDYAVPPAPAGGKRTVPPPRDQRPCDSCVAHALLGAAAAAVASRAGLDVVYDLDTPSVQDFYFVRAEAMGAYETAVWLSTSLLRAGEAGPQGARSVLTQGYGSRHTHALASTPVPSPSSMNSLNPSAPRVSAKGTATRAGR